MKFKKDLAVYALVYNLVRLVMRQAAQHQREPIDRVSFVDAVRWLDQTIAGDATALDLRTNPSRPHRYEPRAIKRRPRPTIFSTCPAPKRDNASAINHLRLNFVPFVSGTDFEIGS
jgi:hypothetical protein